MNIRDWFRKRVKRAKEGRYIIVKLFVGDKLTVIRNDACGFKVTINGRTEYASVLFIEGVGTP